MMKKNNILICFAFIVFFVVAQWDIAYALDNHTTADFDHAASILTDNTHLSEGDDSTLQTDGYGAHGVYISGDKSSWTFGDNSTITTKGGGRISTNLSHGVYVSGDNSQITFGNNSTITTEGNNTFGVYVHGHDSQITFGDNATITTNGESATGVYVRGDNSQITFGDNTTILTSSLNLYWSQPPVSDGAWVAGYNSWISFLGDAKIQSTGNGAVVSGNNSGISFYQTADITTDSSGVLVTGDNSWVSFLGDAKIQTTRNRRCGVAVVGNDSWINFQGDAEIKAVGHGVVASGNNSGISFYQTADITVTGLGEFRTGAPSSVGVSVGNDSWVSFLGAATITTICSDLCSHYTTMRNEGHSGVEVLGTNSRVNFAAGAVISTAALENSHGVWVSGAGSSVNFGDTLVLTTVGDGAHGVYTKDASASIEFNRYTEITTSASDAYALFAEEGTIYSAQASQYMISGDMVADIGTIDLDMTAGSLFTGKTDAGGGNITLNMVGSRWNVTGDSNLTYLSLDTTAVDYSSSAHGTTITTDTLDGPGGTFIMKTDIVNETADMLFLTNTMNGSQHNITVRNNGSAATTGDEIVDLVDTADATGSFQLTHAVDVGAWQYGLRQVSGGGYGSLWQLYAIGRSTITEIIIGDPYSDYLLNYAETQTLIQRLGDLRQTPKQSGFWFKAHGGNFESSSMWTAKSFDMDYWGVQLGYDRQVEIDWNGTVYAGVMFGYGKGDTKYTAGGSDIESKTVGVYGTFVHPNGFFADLVLKYRWSDSNFNATDSAGTLVTGRDASSNGFGASLELGQRIPLRKSEEQKMGWYIEPQVQMSMQRLGGGFFNASNGLQIGAEHYTSLLGRLGMLVGYETENRNFYAKASKVKEFRGDMTILANSDPIDISFASSWWVYGLGYTARINDKNSVYVDLERSSGGLFTQKWALQAGWRIVL